MLGWSVVVTMTASKVGTPKKKIPFYVHQSMNDDNVTGNEGWEQSDDHITTLLLSVRTNESPIFPVITSHRSE